MEKAKINKPNIDLGHDDLPTVGPTESEIVDGKVPPNFVNSSPMIPVKHSPSEQKKIDQAYGNNSDDDDKETYWK